MPAGPQASARGPAPNQKDGDVRGTHDEEKEHRLEHLMELRAAVFAEMEELESELARLRMQIERAESDIRLGQPEPADYDRLKGHDLPEAEGHLLQAFNDLLKLEDKILFTRVSQRD
jgi:hypothetical protein